MQQTAGKINEGAKWKNKEAEEETLNKNKVSEEHWSVVSSEMWSPVFW
jgi:hypothetical protein